jgi:hypothetical protein
MPTEPEGLLARIGPWVLILIALLGATVVLLALIRWITT